MAKYTSEISGLFMAYVKTQPKVNVNQYYQKFNPNILIDQYAYSFMLNGVGSIPNNFTNDDALNKAITEKFCQTFVRHFYGIEIGQENPEHWWVLMRGFLDEYMPLFIQEYQQLFIDHMAFITGISDGTAHNTGEAHGTGSGNNAAVAGNADTPQNELNFKLTTGDPTDDYNFHYSSTVDGSKGTSSQKQDSNSIGDTSTHTQGRSQTIASLVNQLETFANGAYINLFQQAKERWLFMPVNN